METTKRRRGRPKNNDHTNPLSTRVDVEIRRQLEAYIRHHNRHDEHYATTRSVVEAALKMYLKSKGFWPPQTQEETDVDPVPSEPSEQQP